MAVTKPELWKMPSREDHDRDPAAYEAAQKERDGHFKKIQPAGNWKLPICAVIDAADFDDCNEAAIWFTGAGLDVIDHIGTEVVVSGPGYYATIGA